MSNFLDELLKRNKEIDENTNVISQINELETPSVDESVEEGVNNRDIIDAIPVQDDENELEDEINAAEIGEDPEEETDINSELDLAIEDNNEVEDIPQKRYQEVLNRLQTVRPQPIEVNQSTLEGQLTASTKTQQDRLRQLALMKAIKNMGQASAGRYSGNFKANNEVLDDLAKIPAIDVDRIKTLLANRKKMSSNIGLTESQKLNHQLQMARLKERQNRETGKNVRFKRSQDFREDEKQEISDKQTSQLAGYDEALSLLTDAGGFKKDVNTGLVTNLSDKVRTLFGSQDVDVANLKMAIGETLSQKVKSLSGTAASDKERAFINEISLPSINDDDDVFRSKLQRAVDTIEKAKKIRIESYKKQGKDPSAFEGSSPELTGRDKQALDWATANPDDPRSTQILKRLGL